jgi:hypothetical protein
MVASYGWQVEGFGVRWRAGKMGNSGHAAIGNLMAERGVFLTSLKSLKFKMYFPSVHKHIVADCAQADSRCQLQLKSD